MGHGARVPDMSGEWAYFSFLFFFNVYLLILERGEGGKERERDRHQLFTG